MRRISNDESSWKVQNTHGAFRCGAIDGQVDVARPGLGIHNIRIDSISLGGSIACLERGERLESSAAWPAKLSESYVRGADLVASYQASNDWPFAPQIYWQLNQLDAADSSLGAISLLVSVSTHLLDTHPRISAITRLSADEVLRVTAEGSPRPSEQSITAGRHVVQPDGHDCCLLWRLPGGRISYAEIVPATDFHALTLSREGSATCTAEWQLFSEFLEKGVIRRARLHATFLPRERDLELAAACCRDFAARPLPLTT